MPDQNFIRNFKLPKLYCLKAHRASNNHMQIFFEARSKGENCSKCKGFSSKVHDRRIVKIKDEPHRTQRITLIIKKRRFICSGCKSIFTEQIPGIKKYGRVTARLERAILWASENFKDLEKVRRHYKCGRSLVQRCFYQQLQLKYNERKNSPWPKNIGIDEHGFSKDKKRGARNFATLIVNYDSKRVKEVVQGKSHKNLEEGLAHVPGRERVENVVIDLADSYKSFVKKYFPNAEIVADKFHVLRLPTPTLNKKRIGITGDKRTHELRQLLLRNRPNLNFEDRIDLDHWLNKHEDLKEVYWAKEKLHQMYRCRGFNKAKKSLLKLIDWLDNSKQKELQRLKRTLLKWSKEILRYFAKKMTNARTEAFNNRCKLVQRQAYGFKSFENYKLNVMYACG